MGRRLLALCSVLLLTACEDPLVIVGDLPGFMRIVAGIPDSMGITIDSIATRTRLSTPLGVAADSAGFLYIGDTRSRIFRVSSAGKLSVLVNQDPCFADTCIRRPQSIAVQHGGNAIVIADDQTDKIWRVNLVSREVTSIAGTGESATSPDGALAAQSPIFSPTAVVMLPDGRVAFAERNAHRIRVINNDGTLGTIVGTGIEGEAPDSADALTSPINLPTGLALSGTTLYFSETGTHTIRALNLTTGRHSRIAGNGLDGFSGDMGPARDAAFNYPAALVVTGNNLFVSDQNNDRVRVINLVTGTVTTYAGTGSRTYSGNGRPAGEVGLFRPSGLAISPFGFLYITDSGHHIIWRAPFTVRT